jgi:FtsH-binding integral membrane protein
MQESKSHSKSKYSTITTMTIPYSKLESEGEKAQPTAPPDYLMEPGAVHMSSSYQESNQYDPESLLPIATPIAQQDAFKRSDAPMAEVLGFEDKDVRMRFIRKVYGILAAQMALTAAVCTVMIVHKPTQVYVLSHVWPVYTSIGLSFVLLLALMCYKHQRPHNMILLGAFTFVEAFLVGTITTAYCASGYKGVVLEAVFLTCAVFVGLTIFTCQSKIDFSFLGAGLSMALGVLILWGLLSLIFGFDAGYYYALFGCIIFCGYILFDTWLIMEKLEPHEYILAAIMLYLDIINLFLYILRLLSDSNSNN